MQSKYFNVAGHIFKVCLEGSLSFSELSAEQRRVALRLGGGEDIGIRPVSAGDSDTWQNNYRLIQGSGDKPFSFFPYAPFECAESPSEMTFTMRSGTFAERARWTWRFRSLFQGGEVSFFDRGEQVMMVFGRGQTATGREDVFVLDKDFSNATYYAVPDKDTFSAMRRVDMALMQQYLFISSGAGTLLTHASAVFYKHGAVLFCARQGTGKSTHSRLWLEHVPGCGLINDDHPVLRRESSGWMVYGSPWSGKTHCYRNISVPLATVVYLDRGSTNILEPLDPVLAFAEARNSLRDWTWLQDVVEHQLDSLAQLTSESPFFRLTCRPDYDAVDKCLAVLD